MPLSCFIKSYTLHIFIMLNSFTIGAYYISRSFITFQNTCGTSTPPTIITNVFRTLTLSSSLAKYFFDSNIFCNGLSFLYDLLTITSISPISLAKMSSNFQTSILVPSCTRSIISFLDNSAFLSPLTLILPLISLLTLFSTISISFAFSCSYCLFSSIFGNNESFSSFYSICCGLLVKFVSSFSKCTLQLLYTVLVLLSSSL